MSAPVDQTDARVAFIRARLDEDEQAARDSGDTQPAPGDHKLYVWDDDYRHDTIVIKGTRVLREVAAKRQIIAEHYITQGTYEGVAHRVCTRCSDYADRGQLVRPELAPCRTVRLLAECWSDHDDYAALFPAEVSR